MIMQYRNHQNFKTYCLRGFSLFIGTLLTTDAVWLMLLGKLHIGIIVPLLLGVTLMAYALYYSSIHRTIQSSVMLRHVWYLVWLGLIIWLLSFAVFSWMLQQQISKTLAAELQHKAEQANAILVLGSGVVNGKPSPILAKRLDSAALQAQIHPEALILLSGGLGFNEKHTEASVMAEYLQQYYAIAPKRILQENRSTSTELNLKNCLALLQQHGLGLNSPLIIVTSDFHSVRSAAIARHQGYSQIQMVTAPTPLLGRYNIWLREYFAFISGKLLGEY